MVILGLLIGALGGIFGGLGMGGGTVLIPFLTIFLSVEQKMAQGINLLSFVVMALVSLCIHIKNGYIETKGLFMLILGGVTFSAVGACLALVLPTNVLKLCFGVFLCLLAIMEIFKGFRDKK